MLLPAGVWEDSRFYIPLIVLEARQELFKGEEEVISVWYALSWDQTWPEGTQAAVWGLSAAYCPPCTQCVCSGPFVATCESTGLIWLQKWGQLQKWGLSWGMPITWLFLLEFLFIRTNNALGTQWAGSNRTNILCYSLTAPLLSSLLLFRNSAFCYT